MAQPEFGGKEKGRAVMIFGSDGSKWIAALIDALGHLQVDVVTCPLPDDPATQTTLAAVLARLDVDLGTRAKESGGNLAACVTALEKLDDLQKALAGVATEELRITRKEGGISTTRASVNAEVKGSPGTVWWISYFGNAAAANNTIRDGGSGGTIKWQGVAGDGVHVHCVFDPPIECATNIYVKMETGASVFTIGWS